MFKYSAKEINQIALENNYNKNICEKVLRLYSILNFLNKSEYRDVLILKGGTAINIFLMNLPRLSVDIDLDFNMNIDKDNMLIYRKRIDLMIRNFMQSEGYILSSRSKFVHTLDSYVYSYTNAYGGNDVLKIEINYSNRIHLLKPIIKESTDSLKEVITYNCLNDNELIGSKINALIVRTTPRDVYDFYNLYKLGYINDYNLLRKIALFYICISSDTPIVFENIIDKTIKKIENMNFHDIKISLIPLLHKGIKFNLNELKTDVVPVLIKIFVLDDNDTKFINDFNHKIFNQNILFKDYQVEDMNNHPMVLWKISNM